MRSTHDIAGNRNNWSGGIPVNPHRELQVDVAAGDYSVRQYPR